MSLDVYKRQLIVQGKENKAEQRAIKKEYDQIQKAVSYTHLDVYKRQVLWSMANC